MSDEQHDDQLKENQAPVDSSVSRNLADQGFWKEMWHQARLAWHLLKSPEVPWYLKILPIIAVIYVFIPTDLIPDVFPVLGQLDDLTALIVGAKVFIELSPQDVVNQYMATMRQQKQSNNSHDDNNGGRDEALENAIVIEGDFQIVDGENENQSN